MQILEKKNGWNSNNLNCCLQQLEDGQQIKSKEISKMEIIKIKAEIKEIEGNIY